MPSLNVKFVVVAKFKAELPSLIVTVLPFNVIVLTLELLDPNLPAVIL